MKSLWSRLASLWRHIGRARSDFESTPDRGFLSKDATRWLNCVWNYVFKGAIGSVGLVVFFVAACLLVSTCSLLLGLAAPLWQVPVALVHHLVLVLFYDRDRYEYVQSACYTPVQYSIIYNVLCTCTLTLTLRILILMYENVHVVHLRV